MKKRKETETGKTPGSEQLVTNDEAKSGIGDHRTSLHQDCAGKKGPKPN